MIFYLKRKFCKTNPNIIDIINHVSEELDKEESDLMPGKQPEKDENNNNEIVARDIDVDNSASTIVSTTRFVS